MKKEWKGFLISILIPLAVGLISGLLTMGGMKIFATLIKPPLSPPAWLFPVVWSILYTLMGISSYMVYTSKKVGDKEGKSRTLTTYRYQLIVNFLWPVFFFNFQWYFLAFLWLVLLWILVAKMILEFGNISSLAAGLNIPYLLWLGFAAYLNLGIWLLN